MPQSYSPWKYWAKENVAPSCWMGGGYHKRHDVVIGGHFQKDRQDRTRYQEPRQNWQGTSGVADKLELKNHLAVGAKERQRGGQGGVLLTQKIEEAKGEAAEFAAKEIGT